MKKSIIILIAAIYIASGVQAQWHINAGFEGKVVSAGEDNTAMGGIYYGGGYHFVFGKMIGLTTDLYLGKVGSAVSDYTFGGHTYHYDYSEMLAHLPVLLDFRIPLGERYGIHIFGGPSLSYAVTSSRHEWRDDDSPHTYLNLYSSDDVPETERLLRVNVSGMLGAGLRLGWFSAHLGLRVPLLSRRVDTAVRETAASFVVGAGIVF